MSFLCFINFLMFCSGCADTLQAFTIIVLTSVGRLLMRRWSGGVFSHTPRFVIGQLGCSNNPLCMISR